jgi:hypothetical protein
MYEDDDDDDDVHLYSAGLHSTECSLRIKKDGVQKLTIEQKKIRKGR